MLAVAQLLGALLILTAFVLIQRGILKPTSLQALLLNTVGSATLAVVALIGSQWGFLVLNVVWFFVAAAGLIALARKSRNSGSAAEPLV